MSNPIPLPSEEAVTKVQLERAPVATDETTAPSAEDNLLQQITALYNSDQMSAAEQLCRTVLQREPDSPMVHNLLGAILQATGDLIQAREQFHRAIALQPDFASAHANLGNVLKTLGEPDAAITSYDQAIQLTHGNPQLHYNRGNLLLQLGQTDAAIESYQQAIALRPDFAQAFNNRGMALSRSGQLTEAAESYGEAIRIDPRYAAAYSNLGNLLQRQGKHQQAIKNYLQAITLKPDFSDPYYNCGNALQEMGQFEAAIEQYDQAIALKPGDATAYCNRGNALQALELWQDAASSYQQAIRLDPNHTDAHYNYGNLLMELGQLEQSIIQYEKAIQCNPDYADAYYSRGNAFKELGKLERAIESYQHCLQLDPDNHSARHIIHAITGETTETAPQAYVEQLFNKYASNFEESLVGKLHYTMPTRMREALDQLNLPTGAYQHAIDLGCGTGLVGVAFRDLVTTLVGIDLAEEMVHKAAEKQIYDQLRVDTLNHSLEQLNTHFDLFLSADVFIYVGELDSLFATVRRYANPPALFIFSTEHSEGEGDQFYLQESGRYAHSYDYILTLASRHQFELLHFSTSGLRKEKGSWITGGIYILRGL